MKIQQVCKIYIVVNDRFTTNFTKSIQYQCIGFRSFVLYCYILLYISGIQASFLRHVKALVRTMTDMGNPFNDTSGDLLVLDTRVIADPTVVESIQMIEKLGQDKCEAFFNDRFIARSISLQETIRKAKLPLFRKHVQKDKSREQKQLKSLKGDRTLFSTLYIVCQVRQTDMAEFFTHENQSYPPSLSEYGAMRSGTKADLLTCVEDVVTTQYTVLPQEAQMIILDGAAIINMIKPVSDTFNAYVSKIMEYIRAQFKGGMMRVDVVFDIYKKDSLKSYTRHKRGKSTRRRVEGKNKTPGNWQEFLRDDENKSELFHLIAKQVKAELFPGMVIITHDQNVMSSVPGNLAGLMNCTHEEADTRMFVHATHGATDHGARNILIRTVDTDVVILSISLAHKIGCECLWLAFGTGNTFRYIDATAISDVLGTDKSRALPAFHALTGCDVTSSFAGRGKRTAWSAWNALSSATPALCTLAETPTKDNIYEVLPIIERLVVIMYDRGSPESSVNRARQVLFTQKGREIENIPPTQDALSQHLLRVGYAACHVWGQAMITTPQLPSPADFGWTWDDSSSQWKISWMTLPPAGEACRAVIKCGCTKGCRAHCKCMKADLKCTIASVEDVNDNCNFFHCCTAVAFNLSIFPI